MNLIDNILKRLGVEYDGEPSNSGADTSNQETNESGPLNEDELHRDDRPTEASTDKAADGEVFVTMDGDDVGAEVEDSLMNNETDTAKRLSEAIIHAHEALKAEVEKMGGRRVFSGGDNAFFIVPSGKVDEFAKKIQQLYKKDTDHTVTVGIGAQPIEAHKALVYGKNTGKNKVVTFSPEVETQVAEIKKKQEELESTYKQLKYQAKLECSAARDSEFGAAYWVDPVGKQFSVTEDHEAWIEENKEMLAEEYSLSDQVRSLFNEMLDLGWVRVTVYPAEFIMQVSSLMEPPDTLDHIVASLWDGEVPVFVSGGGEDVQIKNPHKSVAPQVARALRQMQNAYASWIPELVTSSLKEAHCGPCTPLKMKTIEILSDLRFKDPEAVAQEDLGHLAAVSSEKDLTKFQQVLSEVREHISADKHKDVVDKLYQIGMELGDVQSKLDQGEIKVVDKQASGWNAWDSTLEAEVLENIPDIISDRFSDDVSKYVVSSSTKNTDGEEGDMHYTGWVGTTVVVDLVGRDTGVPTYHLEIDVKGSTVGPYKLDDVETEVLVAKDLRQVTGAVEAGMIVEADGLNGKIKNLRKQLEQAEKASEISAIIDALDRLEARRDKQRENRQKKKEERANQPKQEAPAETPAPEEEKDIEAAGTMCSLCKKSPASKTGTGLCDKCEEKGLLKALDAISEAAAPAIPMDDVKKSEAGPNAAEVKRRKDFDERVKRCQRCYGRGCKQCMFAPALEEEKPVEAKEKGFSEVVHPKPGHHVQCAECGASFETYEELKKHDKVHAEASAPAIPATLEKTLVRGRFNSTTNRFEVHAGDTIWESLRDQVATSQILCRFASYVEAADFVEQMVRNVDRFVETVFVREAAPTPTETVELSPQEVREQFPNALLGTPYSKIVGLAEKNGTNVEVTYIDAAWGKTVVDIAAVLPSKKAEPEDNITEYERSQTNMSKPGEPTGPQQLEAGEGPSKEQQAKDWFYGYLEGAFDQLGNDKLEGKELYDFLQEVMSDAVGHWPEEDLGGPDSDLFYGAFEDAATKLGHGEVLKQFGDKQAEKSYPCGGCGNMLSGNSGDVCSDCLKKHLQDHSPVEKEKATASGSGTVAQQCTICKTNSAEKASRLCKQCKEDMELEKQLTEENTKKSEIGLGKGDIEKAFLVYEKDGGDYTHPVFVTGKSVAEVEEKYLSEVWGGDESAENATADLMAMDVSHAKQPADAFELKRSEENFKPLYQHFEGLDEKGSVTLSAAHHDSKEEYVEYLRYTLIPDLRDSGRLETADDFETVVENIESGKMDPEFIGFLKDTLIPDLHESGSDATAEDFEDGIYWMTGKKMNVSNREGQDHNATAAQDPKLQQLHEEAERYYQSMNIVPDNDDIFGYVIDSLHEEGLGIAPDEDAVWKALFGDTKREGDLKEADDGTRNCLKCHSPFTPLHSDQTYCRQCVVENRKKDESKTKVQRGPMKEADDASSPPGSPAPEGFKWAWEAASSTWVLVAVQV